MTVAGWAQIAVFVIVLTAVAPVLGAYLARVYGGDRVWLTRVIGPLERFVYRLLRVDAAEGQGWKQYARSVLVFSLLSCLALYFVLRSQSAHPWNPGGVAAGPWDLSFNTATSFVTNTSLGRPTDHQPSEEHRHQNQHQHRAQARAGAAEDNLPGGDGTWGRSSACAR